MIISRHHPVLGTFLEIRILDELDDDTADEIDELVVNEMLRLQSIFNRFDEHSELERWKRGELETPGDELTQLLVTALNWEQTSGGTFSTASRELTELWQSADTRGTRPTPAELSAAVQAISTPRYEIRDGTVYPIGDLAPIDLNAIAKGWIVDRAAELATRRHPGLNLVVNAGGDFRFIGDQKISVGIENPLRPYDNEPPLATLRTGPAGVATSGRARKGFDITGEHHSHVIDPRTGETVDHIASITVVGVDTATADVVATICGAYDITSALARATQFGCACVIVDRDGSIDMNDLGRSLT